VESLDGKVGAGVPGVGPVVIGAWDESLHFMICCWRCINQSARHLW